MGEANRQTQPKDPALADSAGDAKRNSHSVTWSRLIVGALGLIAASSTSQVSRNFPGKKSEIASPDGRYIIQNVDHNDGYTLLLKDTATGAARQVYEYTRGAGVVWSPDSGHFAVDDGAGSDYTETKILSAHEGAPEADVQKEILMRARNAPRGHHEYFYVAYWIDPSRVVVYHWGYGEQVPKWFCECYVYRLNGSVRKCARQPRDSERVCQETTP